MHFRYKKHKNMNLTKVKEDRQDRNSEAWKKLCEYIDELARSGGEEFAPYEVLGLDLYRQIYTLPESISKLKKVKKMWLYGSSLKRIPPEIGEMESLEYFDPYTSYDLMWFPYEITKCKKLKDSRVSTRALYGNVKNGKPFPYLTHNPVRYFSDTVKCSICGKEMTYEATNQLWISLWVGTDILPLLINSCSKECESSLPLSMDENSSSHKGGPGIKVDRNKIQRVSMPIQKEKTDEEKLPEDEKPPLLKLIKKIWDK